MFEDKWADMMWNKQYEDINNNNEVIMSIVTQAELAKNDWGVFFSLSDWLWFSSYTPGICHSLSLTHSVHNTLQNHILLRCTTVEFTGLEDSTLTKIDPNRAISEGEECVAVEPIIFGLKVSCLTEIVACISLDMLLDQFHYPGKWKAVVNIQ